MVCSGGPSPLTRHTQFPHTRPAEPEKEEESSVLFAFRIGFSIALETCWDLLLNYYYISNVHVGLDSFVGRTMSTEVSWSGHVVGNLPAGA